MSLPVSSLYRSNMADAGARISTAIDRACQRCSDPPLVFFRADDIGIGSTQFSGMISCFKKHQLPLCLAVVPAWTNRQRLSELFSYTGGNSSQWYWHQHGYLHRNFEPAGKKLEFGPSRSADQIATSLARGRTRLENLLGKNFQPFFTPPWNRCSGITLETLQQQGYAGISRSRNASPEPPAGLPDFQVNVDLHTRKELEPEACFANLLSELESSLATGLCGIMLHHQRMNNKALFFLDMLLAILKKEQCITPLHFGDLLYQQNQS
jgi:hypothetical protein